MKQSIFLVDRKKELIKKLYLTAMILTLLFVLLSVLVVRQPEWIQTIDTNVLLALEDMRTSTMNGIVKGITILANGTVQTGVTVFIVVILILIRRAKIGVWYGLTEFFGADILNNGLKILFERPRPDMVEHLITEESFSFPSGHAMGSIILYGGLAFLINHLLSLQKNPRRILIVVTSLLALSIGLSRLYLGVHYPTDVLGGFLMGGAWLSLSIAFYYQFIFTNESRGL